MLDLNSSRWSELRHAYGTAEHVPDLLRALAAETEPRYSDETDFMSLIFLNHVLRNPQQDL